MRKDFITISHYELAFQTNTFENKAKTYKHMVRFDEAHSPST